MKINSPSLTILNDTNTTGLSKQGKDLPPDQVVKGQEDEIAKLKKQLSDLQVSVQSGKEKAPEQTSTCKEEKDGGLQVYLNAEAYKNISKEDGFKMLGYFAEKCHKDGYPWKFLKPGGLLKKGKEISLIEAAQRLSRGEEIIMQPMRRMDVNLSPSELASVAGALNPTSAVATAMSNVSEKGNVTANPIAHDMKFGAPFTIKGFGELKLLSELYDPSSQGIQGEKMSDTAKNLSKFIHTIGSNYSWKTMKNDGDGKIWKMLKSAAKKGFIWGLVGLGAGLIVGGGIGSIAAFSFLAAHLIATTAAAGAGAGAVGVVKGARQAFKGEEINAFETISRVLHGEPVIFQKQEMHGIGLPVFGSINYFNDYGKPNVIQGEDELKMFATILPDASAEKSDKPDKGSKKPAK